MKYYIDSVASHRQIADIKVLVTDATMRRRMSHILKIGVGTAMQALERVDADSIDAIITTTALGCLADSEKFLKTVIDNDEQLLNPTPFIQSTFNTIGGQIALLTRNRGYNMTYAHRQYSFESGLLDAQMLLDEGAAHRVLLGAIDELTPTQHRVMERLGYYRHGLVPDEGATFFVVSDRPSEKSICTLEALGIGTTPHARKILYADKSYFTASAATLLRGIEMLSDSVPSLCVVNGDYNIEIACM